MKLIRSFFDFFQFSEPARTEMQNISMSCLDRRMNILHDAAFLETAMNFIDEFMLMNPLKLAQFTGVTKRVFFAHKNTL